jgi:hypothetical protein
MSILEQAIKDKLTKIGKPCVPSGTGFVMTTCLNPEHKDSTPSFSINLETGKGFCFSCGFGVGAKYWGVHDGDIEELERVVKYRGLKKEKACEKDKPVVFLPPVDEAITEDYRGIPAELLKKLGCYISRTGRFANRIIFPIYKYEELIGYDSRTLVDAEPKYLRSKGFVDTNSVYPFGLIEELKPNRVYVVEGILDAISGWAMGIPCICNWGVKPTLSHARAVQLMRLGVDEVVCLFDNDKAGEAVRQQVENSWSGVLTVVPKERDEFASKFYTSEFKDLNEMLVAQRENEPKPRYQTPCLYGYDNY